MSLVNLNTKSSVPKYRQIVSSIEEAILAGNLKKGDQLPSLNSVKNRHSVSRDTVLVAFNELKNRGIITSRAGKGYFVSSEEVAIAQKIFVLFDELNAFKEDLYNSIIQSFGDHIQIDVYFHHFNEKIFSQIIHENLGDYSYYVIMPANLKNTEVALAELQQDKVFMLDQVHPEHANFPAVYQNFEKDVFEGLFQLKNKIKVYKKFNLIYSENKQPKGILDGFLKFCTTAKVPYQILNTFEAESIQKNEAYFVLEDKPLIQIIKQMKANEFEFVKDIGMISYNDSLLKEVIEGGITTISTDFKLMGKQLAEMIKNNTPRRIANTSQLRLRKSI
ncbi:transcriptional regulator [Psychroflexus planctonicus]|uniref:Transcriptional regulator n=1 Tax=Psychroflexus planctonicus TaxID=1526575 RepID=A0ABQ1SHM9_9FLAO|nr:transcriptional regulator [Psychroflexus planctonicus]